MNLFGDSRRKNSFLLVVGGDEMTAKKVRKLLVVVLLGNLLEQSKSEARGTSSTTAILVLYYVRLRPHQIVLVALSLYFVVFCISSLYPALDLVLLAIRFFRRRKVICPLSHCTSACFHPKVSWL